MEGGTGLFGALYSGPNNYCTSLFIEACVVDTTPVLRIRDTRLMLLLLLLLLVVVVVVVVVVAANWESRHCRQKDLCFRCVNEVLSILDNWIW